MPRRPATPAFEDLYSRMREREFDATARGMASLAGPAPESLILSEADEDYVWEWTDPNVRPEHLEMVAQQTRERLTQERTDAGLPMWTPEQIETEVRVQQDRALHPYKWDLIELGRPNQDEQIKYAEAVTRRHQKRRLKVVEGTGWEPAVGDEPDAPTYATLDEPQARVGQMPAAPEMAATMPQGVM